MEPIDLTTVSGGSIQSGTQIHTSATSKLILTQQQKLMKVNKELMKLWHLVSSDVTDMDEFPYLQTLIKTEIIPF